MRSLALVLIISLSTLVMSPAFSVECANDGAAQSPAPTDNDDIYSSACGRESRATGGSATAYGAGSNASAADSMSIGYYSETTGEYALALGNEAAAAGWYSNAIGYQAATDAAGTYSTAIGYRAFAGQANTVILGSIPGVNFGLAYANVGMGTSNPLQAVDVERSGAAARFQLTSFTATGTEAPQFIQRRARGTTAAPTAVLNNDNLGLFSFRGHNGTTMGGSRATITAQAAGNFTNSSTPTRLIFAVAPTGSTTPEQVMVIENGQVKINGQNLNVPDYVFEDDYALMPLEELRAFIEENGHLPGIASAEEVNAGGHDLAGSDMAHLRKIEELTLYTLQQEDRLSEQESRLTWQQERLEAQDVRIAQLEALLSATLRTPE